MIRTWENIKEAVFQALTLHSSSISVMDLYATFADFVHRVCACLEGDNMCLSNVHLRGNGIYGSVAEQMLANATL